MPQKVKHKVWGMGISRDCFWHLTLQFPSEFHPPNLRIKIFIIIFAYTEYQYLIFFRPQLIEFKIEEKYFKHKNNKNFRHPNIFRPLRLKFGEVSGISKIIFRIVMEMKRNPRNSGYHKLVRWKKIYFDFIRHRFWKILSDPVSAPVFETGCPPWGPRRALFSHSFVKFSIKASTIIFSTVF